MGEIKYAYDILVGKPDGKLSLGRPRRGWKDNIKMYIWKIDLECVDYIHLAR